jgi:hypothetical protein
MIAVNKKLFASVLAAASVLTLSACAAGKNAPTSQLRQVTDGIEADSGDIKVRNFLLVTQPDGSAAIVGTIVNQGATSDAITGITVGGKAVTLSGNLNLDQNLPVRFAGDSANAAGSVAGLAATAGSRVDATISFAHAAALNVNPIVREKSDIYANVSASIAAAPTASAAAKAATTKKK